MTDLLNLHNKVALITGAGQNVGREIALYYGAHEAKAVIVNDFYLERAEEVAAELQELGVNGVAMQADVSDHASVMAMSARITEMFGCVDILVNNAGNAGAGERPDMKVPFWEQGPDVWQKHIGVNLNGVINCSAAVIPSMINSGGGRIITIISEAGRIGETELMIYSGAKAGAAGLMRAMARGLGRHNITANCISIAAMNTPAVSTRLRADPEQFKRIMSKYVIRRMGEPGDVAAMALFLASDASGWVTGQTYPVNGGFSFAL
jgi:2-hydroxycyclohexanecarboxyl-CoA dehydrogenase